jgi:hypothetical protein
VREGVVETSMDLDTKKVRIIGIHRSWLPGVHTTHGSKREAWKEWKEHPGSGSTLTGGMILCHGPGLSF